MFFFNVFVYLLFLHLLAWLDSAAMIAVYTDNNTKAKEEVGETRQIQLSLWWRGAGNLVFVDVFVTVFHMVFWICISRKAKEGWTSVREDHLDQTDSIISLVKIEEEQDFSVSVTGFPLCDFLFQFYCICISTLLVFVFHLFCICISTKPKEGWIGARRPRQQDRFNLRCVAWDAQPL